MFDMGHRLLILLERIACRLSNASNGGPRVRTLCHCFAKTIHGIFATVLLSPMYAPSLVSLCVEKNHALHASLASHVAHPCTLAMC